MKKYRILHLKHLSGTSYILQERYLLFWWKNMIKTTSSLEVAISTYLDHLAKYDIHYNKKDLGHTFKY
jgi:hypothetical protein